MAESLFMNVSSAKQVALRRAIALAALALTAGCDAVWNSPYPQAKPGENTFYSSFEERPKHLDPARSYSAEEAVFLAQIYEPPLQYHYLHRPYRLEPLTATALPDPRFVDAAGRVLAADASAAEVAFSIYEIRIRPGIGYQPHPALARDADGRYRYHALTEAESAAFNTLADFPHTGTRELTAADYVYQIKRLAHPANHSPILGLMSEYIVGLAALGERLTAAYGQGKRVDGDAAYLDLREFALSGVEVVDRYTYRITIRGKYPQFRYWLAMTFFAPMPWEADRFYAQPGLAARNVTLDWYPVGTGAYMLAENNPNLRMVLERNPHFHGGRYPDSGEPGDRAAGLLADAGKPIPYIDRAVYSLEKENIPYWNKFLQGYYDTSAISSDAFDQAVTIGGRGEVDLSEEMLARGIELQTTVAPTSFYLGFNMLDPVVGGDGERARKLRQALSIAIDYEEFVSIFLNGRGIPAQGPLPPGIFGYEEGEAGLNPVVYRWRDGRLQRRPLDEARRLLAEAGYPNGRDRESGEPLVLYLDITASGPQDKARLDWFRKQLRKLDAQLVIRNTDYNRFQDKVRSGNAQIFFWGWGADYPDPENFFFLLYGPNGKVNYGGENAANYSNPEFDALFDSMKSMENGPERRQMVDRMLAIVRRDAPWVWGFHPKNFRLQHTWIDNAKANEMARNTLKYLRLDPVLRAELRAEWNRPVTWPLLIVALILAALIVPAFVMYRLRERRSALRDPVA